MIKEEVTPTFLFNRMKTGNNTHFSCEHYAILTSQKNIRKKNHRSISFINIRAKTCKEDISTLI
jgi:hypothetical protein